jgi:hypothetical protein
MKKTIGDWGAVPSPLSSHDGAKKSWGKMEQETGTLIGMGPSTNGPQSFVAFLSSLISRYGLLECRLVESRRSLAPDSALAKFVQGSNMKENNSRNESCCTISTLVFQNKRKNLLSTQITQKSPTQQKGTAQNLLAKGAQRIPGEAQAMPGHARPCPAMPTGRGVEVFSSFLCLVQKKHHSIKANKRNDPGSQGSLPKNQHPRNASLEDQMTKDDPKTSRTNRQG